MDKPLGHTKTPQAPVPAPPHVMVVVNPDNTIHWQTNGLDPLSAIQVLAMAQSSIAEQMKQQAIAQQPPQSRLVVANGHVPRNRQ